MSVGHGRDAITAADGLAYSDLADDRLVAREDAPSVVEGEHRAPGHDPGESHDAVGGRAQVLPGEEVDTPVSAAISGRGCGEWRDHHVVDIGRPVPEFSRVRRRSNGDRAGREQSADDAPEYSKQTTGRSRADAGPRPQEGEEVRAKHRPSLRLGAGLAVSRGHFRGLAVEWADGEEPCEGVGGSRRCYHGLQHPLAG